MYCVDCTRFCLFLWLSYALLISSRNNCSNREDRTTVAVQLSNKINSSTKQLLIFSAAADWRTAVQFWLHCRKSLQVKLSAEQLCKFGLIWYNSAISSLLQNSCASLACLQNSCASLTPCRIALQVHLPSRTAAQALLKEQLLSFSNTSLFPPLSWDYWLFWPLLLAATL